jgi:hypothetical protein
MGAVVALHLCDILILIERKLLTRSTSTGSIFICFGARAMRT